MKLSVLIIAIVALAGATTGCNSSSNQKNGTCDSIAITKAILEKVKDKSTSDSLYGEIEQLITAFNVPASPYLNMTDPVERNHANTWIANYVAANPNRLQRVVFDLDKLATALNYWNKMISKTDANGVSCELMIYDNIINETRYAQAREEDPKKVPGQYSIIISPWKGPANGGNYYHDPTNDMTRPINLGDLHP